MNYVFSETTYPSKDGIHTIYAEIYTPKNCEPKGIIQISHGMIDYVGRYKRLAEFLTGEGYILAGNHHIGHGRSAGSEEDFGFFGEESGINTILRDMHAMNKYLRERFPNLPLFILGHSMGSFITRLYVERYPHSLKGVIIHGTAGRNPVLPFGKALASLVAFFRGNRYRSALIHKLALGGYNSKFPKSEGEFAWLTRDVALVEDRKTDKYTSFAFTVSAFKDLFTMLGACNTDKWFSEYPKELPTLIMSGDMDPVGNYGKGPDFVYKRLLLAGCRSVDIKMYEGARHELFNETNREEVFSDILSWVKGIK